MKKIVIVISFCFIISIVALVVSITTYNDLKEATSPRVIHQIRGPDLIGPSILASKKQELPSGWSIAHNKITGKYRFVRPDGSYSLFSKDTYNQAATVALEQEEYERRNNPENWEVK